MNEAERKLTEALRSRLRYDRGLGRLKPLEHYQRVFGGFDDLVAREYAALDTDPAPAVATPTPATPFPPTPPESARAGEPERSSSSRDMIGPYRILRELGRGGQGTVHLAEDTRLARQVALKTLAPALAASSGMLDRFRREAAIASRLDHPGICTIYEAGEAGGVPYIAMRFIDGETLAARIAAARGTALPESSDGSGASSGATPVSGASRSSVSTRPEVFQIVETFEKVALALHAAHEAGLVHRDMKPANVIIAKDGEPVVLDFGLAREEEADGGGLTMTGSLLGTPAYMSPEQLMAQRIRLDRRTDVYSLGVTLYEALTLRVPFEAPTREALYQRILTTDAPNPRRFNAAIPNDLRVVLETAMEKDRDRRYLTALDFAEDLRRVRELQPIRARPVGRIARLGRWALRNPALATAVAGLFVSLAAGLGVSLALLRDARSERDDKDAALAVSELERKAKETALARAEAMRLAVQSGEALGKDPSLALLLALEAADRQDGPSARGAIAAALAGCAEVRTLEGHEGWVLGVRFVGEGDRVVSTSNDGTARVWETETGRELLVIDARTPFASGPAVTPDGRRMLALLSPTSLGVWDLTSGRQIALVPGVVWSYEGAEVPMSPDGKIAAINRVTAGPALVSVADGGVRELPLPPDSAGPWILTEFSDDGRYLAGWTYEWNAARNVRYEAIDTYVVWDVREAKIAWSRTRFGGRSSYQPFRSDPSGTKLVVRAPIEGASPGAPPGGGEWRPGAEPTDHLRVGEFDIATDRWTEWPDSPAARRNWRVLGDVLVSIGWSVDGYVGQPGFPSLPKPLPLSGEYPTGALRIPGGRLLTWSWDGTARIWSVPDVSLVGTLRGAGAEYGSSTRLDVDRRGRRIVSHRTNSETIRLWRADGSGALPSLPAPSAAPTGAADRRPNLVAWSPDGRTLVVGGREPRTFEPATGRSVRIVSSTGEVPAVLGFSDDGSIIALHSGDVIEGWSVRDEKIVWRVEEPWDNDRITLLSPDAKSVYLGRASPLSLTTIRLADGSVRRPEVPPGVHYLLEFAGATYTSAQTNEAQLRLWDAEAGRALEPIDAPMTGLAFATLGPDRFVSNAWDGKLDVRSRADGKLLASLATDGAIASASRDGNIAVTSYHQGEALLWDTRTGTRISTVPLEGDVRWTFVLSPDGRYLAQHGRTEEALTVWNVATGEQVLGFSGSIARCAAVSFSPSGEHFATVSPSGAVTVWPIDVRAAADAARPRALTLDERLRFLDRPEDREAAALAAAAVAAIEQVTLVPAEARAMLRDRKDLDPAVRSAAMRTVRRWPDEWTLVQRAWPVVMRGGDAQVRSLALRQARAAFTMGVGHRNMRSIYGGVLYRDGRYQEVLKLIGEPDTEAPTPEPALRALELCFLAMSHHRLGQPEPAAARLAELREFLKLPIAAQQTDVRVIAAEVERVLAAPPDAPPPPFGGGSPQR